MATRGRDHRLALSSEQENEAKKFEKKLREIESLEARQTEGEVLDQLQVAKIANKEKTASALRLLKVQTMQAFPGQNLIATVKQEQAKGGGAWEAWQDHTDRCGGNMPGCQAGRDPCKHSDACLADFLEAWKDEKEAVESVTVKHKGGKSSGGKGGCFTCGACGHFAKDCPQRGFKGKGKGEGKGEGKGKGKGKQAGICHDFHNKGSCRFGDDCRFRHEDSPNRDGLQFGRKPLLLRSSWDEI